MLIQGDKEEEVEWLGLRHDWNRDSRAPRRLSRRATTSLNTSALRKGGRKGREGRKESFDERLQEEAWIADMDKKTPSSLSPLLTPSLPYILRAASAR